MPSDWTSAYAAMHAKGEALFPPACLHYVLEEVRKASRRSDSPDGSLTPAQIVTTFRSNARSDFGALLPEVLREWDLRSPRDLGEAVLLLGRFGLLTLSPSDTLEAFAEDPRLLDATDRSAKNECAQAEGGILNANRMDETRDRERHGTG